MYVMSVGMFMTPQMAILPMGSLPELRLKICPQIGFALNAALEKILSPKNKNKFLRNFQILPEKKISL